jgi:hypothetical protein
MYPEMKITTSRQQQKMNNNGIKLSRKGEKTISTLKTLAQKRVKSSSEREKYTPTDLLNK